MEAERKLDSQIFEVIDDMEEYVSTCKPKFMSSTEIVVNKDTMDEFLRDLRRKAPDEIERYRKIIRNQEAILNDARVKAQNLIDQATAQTDELISQNEIMRRAYEQADEVIRQANEYAQNVVDEAVQEANNYWMQVAGYLEEKMNTLEEIVNSSASSAQRQYETLITSLNRYGEQIREEHKQLHPEESVAEEVQVAENAVPTEE